MVPKDLCEFSGDRKSNSHKNTLIRSCQMRERSLRWFVHSFGRTRASSRFRLWLLFVRICECTHVFYYKAKRMPQSHLIRRDCIRRRILCCRVSPYTRLSYQRIVSLIPFLTRILFARCRHFHCHHFVHAFVGVSCLSFALVPSTKVHSSKRVKIEFFDWYFKVNRIPFYFVRRNQSITRHSTK